MIEICSEQDLAQSIGTNKIIGKFPKMKSSKIRFKGENNILYCGDNVILDNSFIFFNGNNSVIYLSGSKYSYKVDFFVNNDSALYIGKDFFVNTSDRRSHIMLSEQKHCIIGNDCWFSFDVWIRNADPHLIYNCESKKRINPTKSIFIGDHVWVGQSAMILKGSQIDSGSIIGAKALISNKNVPQNEAWGGVPCKKLSGNVFWDSACVHTWTEEDTEQSQYFPSFKEQEANNAEEETPTDPDMYIFQYDEKECIPFEKIDEDLTNAKGSMAKYEYLKKLYVNADKNRFAHKAPEKSRFEKLKECFIKPEK